MVATTSTLCETVEAKRRRVLSVTGYSPRHRHRPQGSRPLGRPPSTAAGEGPRLAAAGEVTADRVAFPCISGWCLVALSLPALKRHSLAAPGFWTAGADQLTRYRNLAPDDSRIDFLGANHTTGWGISTWAISNNVAFTVLSNIKVTTAVTAGEKMLQNKGCFSR